MIVLFYSKLAITDREVAREVLAMLDRPRLWQNHAIGKDPCSWGYMLVVKKLLE